MAVYRFRVSFEDYEDISRDIEIRSDQTFLDFHKAIQQSINFDVDKPSSFFISNDFWIKLKEITSHPKTTKSGDAVMLMKNAKLSSHILDPHQKIYYEVDPANPWTFHIELMKIVVDANLKLEYPRVVKVTSDAPKQFINPVPPPDAGDEDFIAIDVAEPEELVEDIVDEDELEGTLPGEEKESGEGEEEFGDVEVNGEEEEES